MTVASVYATESKMSAMKHMQKQTSLLYSVEMSQHGKYKLINSNTWLPTDNWKTPFWVRSDSCIQWFTI